MCPPWATLSLRSASEIWRCVQLLPLHLLAEAGPYLTGRERGERGELSWSRSGRRRHGAKVGDRANECRGGQLERSGVAESRK